ncbi:MAG: RnfABCDGE type electron transport complex subunit B [Candidatus Omnitrophota bacterium]|nr:RnfABCDGE type electron transport complex subunit B [Candidatus Omnitrophota bacterium]
MNTIVLSMIVVGAAGLLFGIILTCASKMFAPETDPGVEQALAALPGINCGACGQGGCRAFAEAVVRKEAPVDGCVAGGDEVGIKIAGIMGLPVKIKQKTRAVLLCNGGRKVKDKFKYSGLKDCKAVNLIFGGQKECLDGCLGFGSCVEACPFEAIEMGPEGLPIVDLQRCTGCGKCVKSCPMGLIILIPRLKNIVVRCNSREKGAVINKICENGCIGCKKCENVCEEGAIKVVDNLAQIDYTKCTNCGKCIEVCPKGTIVSV